MSSNIAVTTASYEYPTVAKAQVGDLVCMTSSYGDPPFVTAVVMADAETVTVHAHQTDFRFNRDGSLHNPSAAAAAGSVRRLLDYTVERNDAEIAHRRHRMRMARSREDARALVEMLDECDLTPEQSQRLTDALEPIGFLIGEVVS